MKKINLKSLMIKAWSLVRMYGMTMSDAMKKAWAWSKNVYRMTREVVKFQYEKVDGTLRTAYGTLRSDLMPAVGSNRKSNDSVQVYFDTEKNAFRCYKIVNLIG